MFEITTKTLMSPYFEGVRDGFKTWECRLGNNNLLIGPINFINKDSHEILRCEIDAIRKYSSFKEAMETLGYQNCIPHATSLDEAISAYHAIPGYTEGELNYGVICGRIKIIN